MPKTTIPQAGKRSGRRHGDEMWKLACHRRITEGAALAVDWRGATAGSIARGPAGQRVKLSLVGLPRDLVLKGSKS